MHIESYVKGLKAKEEGNNIWIKVSKSKLHEVLSHMKSLGLGRISSISGVDNEKHFEVIYHFIHKNRSINVRVSLDKKKPEVESITSLFPGANLFERELFEMMGINVRNHPNLKKLFLDKNSPKNPMKKS